MLLPRGEIKAKQSPKHERESLWRTQAKYCMRKTAMGSYNRRCCVWKGAASQGSKRREQAGKPPREMVGLGWRSAIRVGTRFVARDRRDRHT